MKKLGIYVFLAITLLLIVLLSKKQVQNLLSFAAPRKAQIEVKTDVKTASAYTSWSNFAQGGEEPPPMLASVIPPLANLSPTYVRIDHIYDSYSVVERQGSGFRYDFQRLDQTVNDILKTGATPFLSLSYMPSVFTSTGSIIDAPSNWNDWKDLVRTTIEHYSGKNNKNINNVYYEVWNEPELPQFGSWKLEGTKDYRLLYFHAAAGAQEAENVNQFFIGGPSVGSYYQNWVDQFLSYCLQNNLRLDFYSWHRYAKKPDIFATDSRKIRQNLQKYPAYATIPLVLSEWGIDSENTNNSSSPASAAFSISSAASFYKDINLAFVFEVKDGPPPEGGKWGLITHEKNPNQKLFLKPRYHAFAALSKLKGDQLQVVGEGTYVSAIATASTANGLTVVLSNYDPAGKNVENVPITFTGLPPAAYKLRYTYPLDRESDGEYELVTTDGTLAKSFLMPASSILLLQLTASSQLAHFIQGKGSAPHDQALVLNQNQAPLVFTSPQFKVLPSESISFDIKMLWDPSDTQSFYIFELPYSISQNKIEKIYLLKQATETGNFLIFGMTNEGTDIKVSSPITTWTPDSWHHIIVEWNPNGLSMKIDEAENLKIDAPLQIRNGKILTFAPIHAAIDNLSILIGEDQSILRTFDGSVDK